MIYYFLWLFFRELNPDLKANLNGNSFRYHLIQITIMLKKLYFHRKWQSHLTWKSFSIFIIYSKFIWMRNWICIKFPNQCKEQTNSKVPSNILPLYKALSWIWWLNVKNKLGSQICLSVYNFMFVLQFNVCLPYNTQSTEYYKADISKYISFSMNIDPFIESIFESSLYCSFLVWAQNFSTIQ